MRQVAIYIQDEATGEYNRLDLFSDEKISVTSSIQNINDISKTYTDFSQTFTIPGSKNNNRICKYWYENSLQNGFSTLNKSDAYIEIDTFLFRRGKIQLESANLQDGQIKNYSITFIGTLGNLKDKFANLSLKDIDFSEIFVYTYNATNVKNAVTTTAASGMIMWPLITSLNNWSYAGGVYDINQNNHPIYYDELFPAMKLSALLIAIGYKFNINFNGEFLNDKRFTNAYLWLKNADTFKFSTELFVDIDYAAAGASNPLTTANYTTNTISLNKWSGYEYGPYSYDSYIKFTLSIRFTTAGQSYDVLVYRNGLLVNTLTKTTTTTLQTFTIFNANYEADDSWVGDYTFKIKSNTSLNFYNVIIGTELNYFGFDGTDYVYNRYTTDYIQSSAQILSSDLNLTNYMPDIKVEEFFSGLLKMFNLTCYSNDGINYNLEQLENYYSNGEILDITKYVKSDTATFNRVNTYSKINFEYQPSESVVNKGFLDKWNIEYGTLKQSTDFDGSEYSIKLPFEDLEFQEFTGTTLQVGYALKTDYQKYIPKPIILYDYNATAVTPANATYHFATSATGVTPLVVSSYTQYKAFGQETAITKYGVENFYSLNFPTQQSTLTNTLIEKGLYNQYYLDYLGNTFKQESRLLKTSALLPTSILTNIKLNNRIVIKDKRYIINTMVTDLTSGETQFDLLTDFRSIETPIITTLIGSANWTIKNLDVTTYRDGTAIPQVTDQTAWAALTTGAWCYYNNDPTTVSTYGLLYNWYAVNDTVHGGLAPVGFHIPTDTEWTTMSTVLGTDTVSGGKLKEVGITHWNTPNTGATDIMDFTALPNGYRNTSGFFNLGIYAYFWSSTADLSTTAWARRLAYNASSMLRTSSNNKKTGMSIRLIKN